MIRDAIVFGTKDHKVREKCINEGSEFTLEKAINYARTHDLLKAQLKCMTHAGEEISVNAVSVKHKQIVLRVRTVNFGEGPFQNNRKRAQSQKPYGNRSGMNEPKKCPAFGKT